MYHLQLDAFPRAILHTDVRVYNALSILIYIHIKIYYAYVTYSPLYVGSVCGCVTDLIVRSLVPHIFLMPGTVLGSGNMAGE